MISMIFTNSDEEKQEQIKNQVFERSQSIMEKRYASIRFAFLQNIGNSFKCSFYKREFDEAVFQCHQGGNFHFIAKDDDGAFYTFDISDYSNYDVKKAIDDFIIFCNKIDFTLYKLLIDYDSTTRTYNTTVTRVKPGILNVYGTGEVQLQVNDF